jgi:hypothetical protein
MLYNHGDSHGDGEAHRNSVVELLWYLVLKIGSRVIYFFYFHHYGIYFFLP